MNEIQWVSRGEHAWRRNLTSHYHFYVSMCMFPLGKRNVQVMAAKAPIITLNPWVSQSQNAPVGLHIWLQFGHQFLLIHHILMSSARKVWKGGEVDPVLTGFQERPPSLQESRDQRHCMFLPFPMYVVWRASKLTLLCQILIPVKWEFLFAVSRA